MGEIRIVGQIPYPVCKKRIIGPDKTRGYSYPVCKNMYLPWVYGVDRKICHEGH